MDMFFVGVPTPDAVSFLVRGYAHKQDAAEAISPSETLAGYVDDEDDLFAVELMLTHTLGVDVPHLEACTTFGDLYEACLH